MTQNLNILMIINKAVADGPVGQVLAGPLLFQGKNEIPFCSRKAGDKQKY